MNKNSFSFENVTYLCEFCVLYLLNIFIIILFFFSIPKKFLQYDLLLSIFERILTS